MTELTWIADARKHVGLKEVKGIGNNPIILSWLDAMGNFSKEDKAWWSDDSTPWCGLFVGYILGVSDRFVVKNWFRALAWNDSTNMTKLVRPAYGCIVTFTRKGGGHCGFVVGRDAKGNIMVLGGNQGDSVSIIPFGNDRNAQYYWPSIWSNGKCVKSVPAQSRYILPLLQSNGKVSTNEA